MGEPIKMRIRDGCRGGREQFTWNSIKEQEFKDRECYLGQSTKVGMMGKFGQYYRHDWYARKRDTPETIETERSAVQAYEEELMQEALGLKPKKLLLAKKQLTEEEMKELLKPEKNPDKKGREAMGPQKKLVKNEYGEQVAQSNEDYVADAVRDAPLKGLGFASHRTAKLEEIKAKTLGVVGQLQGSRTLPSDFPVKKEEPGRTDVKAEEEDEESASEPATSSRAPRRSSVKEEKVEVKQEQQEQDDVSPERRKREKKEKKQKKIEKKLRKLEKKEKKLAKKEKRAAEEAAKAAKRAKRSRSSSSESSS